MSQLNDLKNVVVEHYDETFITKEEADKLFLRILGAIEWSLVLKDPKKEDESTDYDKLDEMEAEMARKLLWEA